MQLNTHVPIGKHNNRQHASPHHEVATDVKQMPIRPIIIKQMPIWPIIIIVNWTLTVKLQSNYNPNVPFLF